MCLMFLCENGTSNTRGCGDCVGTACVVVPQAAAVNRAGVILKWSVASVGPVGATAASLQQQKVLWYKWDGSLESVLAGPPIRGAPAAVGGPQRLAIIMKCDNSSIYCSISVTQPVMMWIISNWAVKSFQHNHKHNFRKLVPAKK